MRVALAALTMYERAPLETLTRLLDVPDDAPVMLHALDVRDWGRVLVLSGVAGAQPFVLRYDDCREFRWRVYAHEQLGGAIPKTAVVSFIPGRDQQRSPAQLLTMHFGLSLWYGSLTMSVG